MAEAEDEETLDQIKNLFVDFPHIPRDKIHSHWHSLDLNSKNEFLRVKIGDLSSHFEIPETHDSKLEIFLRSVVARACAGKPWITWVCFVCEDFPKEFHDSESHWKHVKDEHLMNDFSPELLRFWTKCNVDELIVMVEMIGRCSWKPLDISSAIEMLKNQAKSEGDGVKEAVQDWPLSDDCERAAILNRIKGGFDVLIQNSCLSLSHLTHIINVAKDEISRFAGSQILTHALDQSLDCICFLGAIGLKKIFKFMLEVSHGCSLTLTLNRNTDPTDDLPDSIQFPPDIKEEIRLSEDSSCFLLDGCLVTNTGSTIRGNILEDVISRIDSFIPWIFSRLCYVEWLHWDIQELFKTDQAPVLVQDLKKYFDRLKHCLEEKSRLMKYDTTLKLVEDLCREVKNEKFIESVLRERTEDLSSTEEQVRDVISNVLEEVRKLNSESDCDKSCIKMVIEKLKLDQSKKLDKIDGALLKSVAEIDRSKTELSLISRFDYRLGFLPFVKAYSKARLVDSFEREATIKSDAARYALLSELAEESSKSIKEKSDSAKQSEKKTKNKRSARRNRKMNKLKAKDDDELKLAELAEELEAITLEDEQHDVDTAMADHSPVSQDEKSPNEVRLEEIEAEKKILAETEKEVEAAERLIEEMTMELEEKKKLHAQELTELQNEDKDEEKIKNELDNHADRGKTLEAEEKFIQEMVTELREKQECLVKQRKQLAIEEEMIKS